MWRTVVKGQFGMTPKFTNISISIFLIDVVARIWGIPSYKGKFGTTHKVTISISPLLEVVLRIWGIPPYKGKIRYVA